MTEEQEAEETEVVAEEAPEEVAEETAEETPSRGTDFVEFDDPKVEQRFRRIYHNMKESEKIAAQAIEDGKKMAERISTLELTQDRTTHSGEISEVKAALIKAKEDGDITNEVELTAKLTQLSSMQPKEKEVVEETVDTGPSEHDLSVMRAWASETDEEGNLVRPYAQETSPQLRHVAALGQSITTDPSFAGATMQEVLAEVDRKMVKRKAPGVIDPADNRGGKKGKAVKLNADQKAVARKMNISEADYAKNIGA